MTKVAKCLKLGFTAFYLFFVRTLFGLWKAADQKNNQQHNLGGQILKSTEFINFKHFRQFQILGIFLKNFFY